jgi:hypothetical protein
MKPQCSRWPALLLLISPLVSRAQTPNNAAQVPNTTTPVLQNTLLAAQPGDETRDALLRGRSQLDSNDARAVLTLRDASQRALVALGQVAGPNILMAVPESLPNDVVTAGLAQKAAEAHYYWGLAADRFARRDEAITAFSRAVRLSRAVSGPTTDGGTLRRDAAQDLGRVLREGLPLIAPDDALDSIATIAHRDLWTPRRFSFDPSGLSSEIEGATLPKSEFLITDGKLFPPVGPNNTLARVPPLYQSVPPDSLPPSLKLDKMVAGYARETSGPNKGQWRQNVRVFYASPYLTKDKRDDFPRAKVLCEQFLRVSALFRSQIGAQNLYARGDRIEGVTTLWLLEISALWPQDDDDPAILAQLGPLMPDLNTGPKRDATDPVVTALMRPWMPIAGHLESDPGEMLFWKSSLARSEAEWIREICHEYGHVALPPLGGFRPPLEPYANGMMGETLGLLWVAGVPNALNLSGANRPAGATAPKTPQVSAIEAQITAQTVPALKFFLQSRPESALRASGSADGWKYLQGLTIYLERVYGGKTLGRVLSPLSLRAAKISDVAVRRSLLGTQNLMGSLDTLPRDSWGSSKTIPIWLPGAFNLSHSADSLVRRGETVLKANTSTRVLLFVPPGADSLRIDGVGTGQLRCVGLPFTNSNGAMRIYFAGKSGWQNFSIAAGADAKVSTARFERK